MKAISIQQPWASAAVLGGIEVISTTFQARHRGDLLIHAGRKDPRADMEQVRQHLHGQELAGCRNELIGVVELVEVAQVECCDLPWAFGPNCWIIRNPRVFKEPVPWPDFKGITVAQAEAVRAAIDAAMTPAAWDRWRRSPINPDDVHGRRRADGFTGD